MLPEARLLEAVLLELAFLEAVLLEMVLELVLVELLRPRESNDAVRIWGRDLTRNYTNADNKI